MIMTDPSTHSEITARLYWKKVNFQVFCLYSHRCVGLKCMPVLKCDWFWEGERERWCCRVLFMEPP